MMVVSRYRRTFLKFICSWTVTSGKDYEGSGGGGCNVNIVVVVMTMLLLM